MSNKPENFTLKVKDLKRLADLNFFSIPKGTKFMLFGLRGCMPIDRENYKFSKKHALKLMEVDHKNLACTIGQWDLVKNTFSVYPGSTVPHISYIKKYNNTLNAYVKWIKKNSTASIKKKNKERAKIRRSNMLLTGYFPYVKGPHRKHPAFRLRNLSVQPILRTKDDAVFESNDVYEVSNPTDNIHYASCNIHGRSSGGNIWNGSAGCQVVAGFQKEDKKPNPWITFREKAYSIEGQKTYNYMLLMGDDAYRVVRNRENSLETRIRFGSKLKNAKGVICEVQKYLGFKGKDVDGHFGKGTFKVVRKYQESYMAPSCADGIIGPDTASMMGITLPKIDADGKMIKQ